LRDFDDPAPSSRARLTLAVWLFSLCAMIFLMVLLGGLTRLTHSGLSIVEWRPVSGILPPMGAAEWQDAFDQYKQFPEYKAINQGMTLDEFQSIFWLEYIHRLWGRLIGLAFFVPFLVFLKKGWVDRHFAPKLLVAFVLGGLQGVLGWYMVKSGLADRPDVSQYRLTAHLGAALAIYGYLLWLALEQVRPVPHFPEPPQGLRRAAIGLLCLIGLTILAGGFVAGLDAGMVYNTFPLMNGQLIPDEAFSSTPWYLSLFENQATVQFDHRVLAVTTFLSIFAFRVKVGDGLPTTALYAANALVTMATAQVMLGIATLLFVVPVPLAELHQIGALVLFSLGLWMVFELRPRGIQRRAKP
jgi:cytochrome c oxidase assembly protein subunit 15